jgi:hypothetical protein
MTYHCLKCNYKWEGRMKKQKPIKTIPFTARNSGTRIMQDNLIQLSISTMKKGQKLAYCTVNETRVLQLVEIVPHGGRNDN